VFTVSCERCGSARVREKIRVPPLFFLGGGAMFGFCSYARCGELYTVAPLGSQSEAQNDGTL